MVYMKYIYNIFSRIIITLYFISLFSTLFYILIFYSINYSM